MAGGNAEEHLLQLPLYILVIEFQGSYIYFRLMSYFQEHKSATQQ